MKYFTLLTNFTNPQNKLQDALLSELSASWDRNVVSSETTVIGNLEKLVKELNEKHPRTYPLRVGTFRAGKGTGISFSDRWTCTLHIYRVQTDFTDI